MASNLAAFGLPERLRCSLGIKRAAEGATSVEAAARRFCRFFLDELVDTNGDRACALVRCYVTERFSGLPSDIQAFARNAAGGQQLSPDIRCLTLVGTAGSEPAWNSRTTSEGHQAIPLLSTEIVEKAPMIAQLIRAFGLSVSDVVQTSGPVVLDLGGKSYGVFYVPDAKGSSYIPAQEQFVLRYGIRSVVGCGGALTSGELFALIFFSRIHVRPDAAERFRALALDVKAALVLYGAGQVFDGEQPSGGHRARA